jgi:hypothetical protein
MNNKQKACKHDFDQIEFDGSSEIDGDTISYPGTCACGLDVQHILDLHSTGLHTMDGKFIHNRE